MCTYIYLFRCFRVVLVAATGWGTVLFLVVRATSHDWERHDIVVYAQVDHAVLHLLTKLLTGECHRPRFPHVYWLR